MSVAKTLRTRATLLPRALALLLALGALLAPAAGAKPSSAGERFTPVVASVLAPPEPVLASDGRRHLAYELLVINRSFNPPAKVTLRGVTALAGGRALASLRGSRLAAVTFPFGGTEPGADLAPGEAGYVLMDVSLPAGRALPHRLVHRLAIETHPANDVVAHRYLAAPTRVSGREAVVVAPPLRGGGWIVGNGCCAELTSHRAGVLPVDGALAAGERFAIDFIQVDPAGLLTTGSPTLLSSYPFFGDEVISATPGRVVSVVDDLPETPPGALPPTTARRAAGNNVVVALGHDRYALYAHLQPGSVAVHPGERVRVGQLLGRLGSSGNSNAPHLHFQLMDGPTPLAANGIPYRFDRFAVAGRLTNFSDLFEGDRARIAPQFAGSHRAQLPLNQQVIGFAP